MPENKVFSKIVEDLALQVGLPKKDVYKVIRTFANMMPAFIVKYGVVKLRSLGRWELVENPREEYFDPGAREKRKTKRQVRVKYTRSRRLNDEVDMYRRIYMKKRGADDDT